MVRDAVRKRQGLDGFQDRRAGPKKTNAVGREREEPSNILSDCLHQDSPVPPAYGPRHLDKADHAVDDGIVRNGTAPVGVVT